jgi:hypothetical protein
LPTKEGDVITKAAKFSFYENNSSWGFSTPSLATLLCWARFRSNYPSTVPGHLLHRRKKRSRSQKETRPTGACCPRQQAPFHCRVSFFLLYFGRYPSVAQVAHSKNNAVCKQCASIAQVVTHLAEDGESRRGAVKRHNMSFYLIMTRSLKLLMQKVLARLR